MSTRVTITLVDVSLKLSHVWHLAYAGHDSGSTVVYPYDNASLPELELGASIFVKANKNLWRASDEFNLTRRDFHELDYETGIWDGEKMLLSVRDHA